MKKEKNHSFSISLKAARINSNLYQKEVAYKIGVEEETIRNWEKGRSQPTPYYINQLLELYQLKYEDINWDDNFNY